jgi:hypothetical protein
LERGHAFVALGARQTAVQKRRVHAERLAHVPPYQRAHFRVLREDERGLARVEHLLEHLF